MVRDIAETDQTARLNKLRRKLRINLDAGSKNHYGDTRKAPHRTRAEIKRDLENNNTKLIETIWHAIKHFDCIRILRRPKLHHARDHEHNQHGGELLYSEYDTPRYEESSRSRSENRLSVIPFPDEEVKKGRLPRIMRDPHLIQQQLQLQEERNRNKKLPRLAPMYRI